MKIAAAVDLLLALIGQLESISSKIAAAKAAGREELTEEEWQLILEENDLARDALADAIARAAAEGR